MQFEGFYSLNQSMAVWFVHLHKFRFQPTLTNLGICVGNDVNVKPYAHTQPEKVVNLLMYVWPGHRMQFERFYRLNQSIVAWFAHLHLVGFRPTLANLEKQLWW